MKIKRFLSWSALLLLLAANNANAFFFLFIPGSMTGKITDALTGSEGENCVGPNAKVGDTIRLPNGNLSTVKSLSGTSSRCTQPEFPIRAMLTPKVTPTSDLNRYIAKAGIDLPSGWEPIELPERQRANGFFFGAKNSSLDAGLGLSARKREGIADMLTYFKSRRDDQISRLNDAQSGEIETLEINGRPAWRCEIRGTGKSSGKEVTFMLTILDGGSEIVILNAWMNTPSPELRAELRRLAYNISGLDSQPADPVPPPTPTIAPASPPAVAPPPVPAAPAPVMASTPPGSSTLNQVKKSVAERLSELNQLHKNGLITDDDYSAKKKEILQDL